MNPQSKWLPLRQAVFQFGIGPESEHRQTKFFDVAPFLKSKNLPDPQPDPPSTTAVSLQDLTEILREKSGADSVEIDQTGGEPAFVFAWHGGRRYGGPPWAILAEPAGDRVRPAELPANARLATAKEQAVLDGIRQAARAATSLVWHQFMVRNFNRAVSTGAVVLYARPETLTADFAQLPADVWPMLEVADWQNGVAVAPDNTAYWSIYAVASSDTPEVAECDSGVEAPAPKTVKKRATIEAYTEYQRAHKARTGEYSTREDDEAWARANHYSVRHIRNELRQQFFDSLSLSEQTKFRSRRKNRR